MGSVIVGKCDRWEVWWSGYGMVGKCGGKGGGGCGGVGGGLGYVNVKWNKIAFQYAAKVASYGEKRFGGQIDSKFVSAAALLITGRRRESCRR